MVRKVVRRILKRISDKLYQKDLKELDEKRIGTIGDRNSMGPILFGRLVEILVKVIVAATGITGTDLTETLTGLTAEAAFESDPYLVELKIQHLYYSTLLSSTRKSENTAKKAKVTKVVKVIKCTAEVCDYLGVYGKCEKALDKLYPNWKITWMITLFTVLMAKKIAEYLRNGVKIKPKRVRIYRAGS